jgi:hypothetical protein
LFGRHVQMNGAPLWKFNAATAEEYPYRHMDI